MNDYEELNQKLVELIRKRKMVTTPEEYKKLTKEIEKIREIQWHFEITN